MNRSVLITGQRSYYSPDDEERGFSGIVTRQADGGVMVVDYARIENCGRVALGRYCLHFHYIGMCPKCRLRGNVITKSNNKGITVHSTHHSLIDNNIVYDHKGPFVYVENEMNMKMSSGIHLYHHCMVMNSHKKTTKVIMFCCARNIVIGMTITVPQITSMADAYCIWDQKRLNFLITTMSIKLDYLSMLRAITSSEITVCIAH